jgi:hypothetical protein
MSVQSPFAQALLNASSPLPDGLTTWNGSNLASRFAVYRNNIFASLIDALADTYPVVQQLVGEEFFRAMAKVFVQTTTPKSRLMAYYGTGFANFITSFPPVRVIPYLADVARLEMARVETYHAADANPIDLQHLQTTLSDPGSVMSLHLALHPSVRVICSPSAIASLWAAHHGELRLGSVDTDQAESVLIFRNGLDVEMLKISEVQACFITALQRDANLIEAAEQATATDQDFDLPQMLAMLMGWQLLTNMIHEDIHP